MIHLDFSVVMVEILQRMSAIVVMKLANLDAVCTMANILSVTCTGLSHFLKWSLEHL